MNRFTPATYDDAQLVLRLYELRREEKLRAAREWFGTKFFPQSMDDVKAVALGTGLENTYYRMVTSYWDMAASFVAHGILNSELFLESGSEMLFVWAKLGEFVAQIRQELVVPRFLANVEKVVGIVAWAPERVQSIRTRLPQYRERMMRHAKPSA